MKIIRLTLAILFVAAAASPTLGADERPNFLFLLSDDQSWTGLSCRMHPEVPVHLLAKAATPDGSRGRKTVGPVH